MKAFQYGGGLAGELPRPNFDSARGLSLGMKPHHEYVSLAINSRLTVTRDQPLLAYLFCALELRRAAVKNLLKFGAVRVNGATVRQFDHLLSTTTLVPSPAAVRQVADVDPQAPQFS
jgi:hypothetical protein